MSLRVLHIALDTQHTQPEALPTDVEHQLLGGRGAAVWLLAARVTPEIAPRSPANSLIISAGPLAGVIPVADGYTITTRSPLTGSITHAWGVGRIGAMLRRAGLDMLRITGQSSDWCVIQVNDGAVTIRPATALLGLDTFATARTLSEELGSEYAVICLGPAGEAGVAYCSVVADGLHMAEPAGAGAIMAHKRIKAIAVRGSARLTPADPKRAETVLSAIRNRVANSELAGGIRKYGGSVYYTDAALKQGLFSSKNGQDGDLPNAAAIDRNVLAQRGRREARGCDGCPLPCGSTYIRRNGEPMAYPELESVAAFGAACGITNPDTLIVLNDLCLRLGLDVVATGAALAFMMECQQKGLSRAGTLPWGDSEAILAAVKRLGQRQEKRDALSLGVAEIQDIYYGSGTFAPQVKGMAMPGLDPRVRPELALAYAASPTGSDHRYAMTYESLLDEPPAWLPVGDHPQAIKGSVARLIWHERFAAAIDSAGICRRLALMAYQIAPSEVSELIAAGIGRSVSGVEFARMGERIVTLERLLSIHYESDPDGLPHRWEHDPLESGPAIGKLQSLDSLLPEYYRRHGWNEYGEPTSARITELGLTLPE